MEIVKLLESLFMLTVPNDLIVFTYHYNKNPDALFNFRRQVAELIVKLQK